MPGLVVFKRRWGTGSDDLVLPTFILALTHLTLFIVIAVYLITSHDLNSWSNLDIDKTIELNGNASDVLKAKCANEIKYFSFGYLGLLITALLIEIVIIGFSAQGTIMDPAPRKPVELLIYIRIVLGIIEVVYTTAVGIKIIQDWHYCSVLRTLFNVQAGIIAVNAFVLLVVLLTTICTFDSAGGAFYRYTHAVEERHSPDRIDCVRNELNEDRKQFWKKTFAKCFCCRLRSSNTKAALDETAQMFGNFFRNYDLVPSDLVAGFILLRHKQEQLQDQVKLAMDNPIKEFMCGRPITDSTVFLNPTKSVERQEFELMTYYCQFAVASYGPLMYMYDHTSCGLCLLAKECMCGTDRDMCCPPSRGTHQRSFPNSTVHDDLCCQWRTSAIRNTMFENGIYGDVDLVYVSWNNELYKQPFFVAVDHKNRSVVVTIRGTLSDIDALTDIVATPTPIPLQGADASWKAHKGILQGAVHIKQKLLGEEMILSQAFGRDIARGTRDYNLVIVGHSLGAGVAAILSILLHQRYPSLMCYCYAPPGGLLSLSAMQGSKDYINTVVLGKDLITRTGLTQLERLRNEIIQLLKQTKLPKYQLILGNIAYSREKLQKLLHGRSHSEQNSDEELERLMCDRSPGSDRVQEVLENEDLFPPGRILHVVYRKSEEAGCCSRSSKQKQYFVIESDNMRDFNEIIISQQMVSHHFPNELLKAMRKVAGHTEDASSSRRYTEAETLPVGGIERNGKSRRSDLVKKQNEAITEQPPADLSNANTASISTPNTSRDTEQTEVTTDQSEQHQQNLARAEALTIPNEEIYIQAPLARMDSFSESGSSYSVDMPTSPSGPLTSSSSKKVVDVIMEVDEPLALIIQNENSNNNSNAIEETNPSSQIETKKDDDSNEPDTSLVSRFGNYIDVVLSEPREQENEDKVKYKRSESLPTGRMRLVSADTAWSTLDRDTISRAMFEPNLIPKPPRTHSSRRATRPDDLPVPRTTSSSAPSSKQNTPHTPPPPLAVLE